MTDLATNVLYYGDNLDILRRYLPDAAGDLVYFDPPFNSNRESYSLSTTALPSPLDPMEDGATTGPRTGSSA
jgi:hypothetical protein